MSGYGWVKLNDTWMLDGTLCELMAADRHDAVNLFLAMIAFAHAQDTDGVLTEDDVATLTRLITAREGAFELLITTRKVARTRGNTPRATYRIAAYERWQTTSDQRGNGVTSRARAGTRAREEREERKTRSGRPATPKRPPSAGEEGVPRRVFDDLDPDELLRRASLRIVDIESGGAL